MFSAYLKLGIDHILDPNGYDHILFVTVLCALYSYKEWKKVILLVTAFTVGHTATLALSSLDIVAIDPGLVEKLIPITIIITAMSNILIATRTGISEARPWVSYLVTVGFGLIHGLGFSNYFKALVNPEESIIFPLFSFNCGVEAGQVVVVLGVMALSWLVTGVAGLHRKWWTIPISGAGMVVAIYLLAGR
jgi:ABC-type antimicrobial peptide transport system permease subunit